GRAVALGGSLLPAGTRDARRARPVRRAARRAPTAQTPTRLRNHYSKQEVQMSHAFPSSPAPRRRDPVAAAGLVVAMIALVVAATGETPAQTGRGHAPGGARNAALARKFGVKCPITNAVTFGSWCLESSPHVIPANAVGKNDYFYATQT